MIQVLKYINKELKNLKIPYSFDNWSKDVVLPYFVGEISEVPTNDEDGKREFNFTLTGEDVKSYIELFNYNATIRKNLKDRSIKTDNGVMRIMYQNMIPIPVEAQSVKRIQINFTVYLWEDN